MDTTQDDKVSVRKFEIDFEEKSAIKHFREMEMVREETPEDIRSPVNYRGNYEEKKKTEEIPIGYKGTREINEYTKFQSLNRSRSGSLSSKSESEDPILVRKDQQGNWETVDLTDVRSQEYGADTSQYHDLEEDGIRRKVNWSKGGKGRRESGSGCNYLIYKEAIENYQEAYLVKHIHKQKGSKNGSYNKDKLKIWELKRGNE
jgi:hypothetical protein